MNTPTELIPLWASAYLGIPYDAQGESRSGANCWGFFRLVQREVFGLNIPALGISGDDIKALLDAFHNSQHPERAHWRALPLAQARSGDALLCERPYRLARPHWHRLRCWAGAALHPWHRFCHRAHRTLATADIAAMTSNQAENLSTDAIAALTTEQVVALSSAALNALTSDQLTAIETADVAVLSTAQISNLSTKQVALLGTNQIVALSTAQLATLTTAQTNALTTEQLGSMSSAQLASLSLS